MAKPKKKGQWPINGQMLMTHDPCANILGILSPHVATHGKANKKGSGTLTNCQIPMTHGRSNCDGASLIGHAACQDNAIIAQCPPFFGFAMWSNDKPMIAMQLAKLSQPQSCMAIDTGAMLINGCGACWRESTCVWPSHCDVCDCCTLCVFD